MYGSPTWGIYVALAAMLFLLYLMPGLEGEATRRCGMCGTKAGEKHAVGCPWG